MIEERLTERERQALINLLILAYTNRDPGERETYITALRKLSGVDTVIVVRRAYPSEKREL